MKNETSFTLFVVMDLINWGTMWMAPSSAAENPTISIVDIVLHSWNQEPKIKINLAIFCYRKIKKLFITSHNVPRHVSQRAKRCWLTFQHIQYLNRVKCTRSAYHWQTWVEACGGTEQAVTAYAVLVDVFLFFCSAIGIATVAIDANNCFWHLFLLRSHYFGGFRACLAC